MATLAPWTGFSGTNPDVDELSAKLYDPADYDTSMSILNGYLDSANYGGGNQGVPTWAVQPGAFMAGAYYGFERWEFTYAKQAGYAENVYAVHGGLSTKWWLPWDASVLLVGVQGFFRQDATDWSDGNEIWLGTVGLRKGSNTVTSFDFELPSSRGDNSVAAGSGTDPGAALENRWRYLTKTVMHNDDAILSKGYFTLRVDIGANILFPDDYNAKCATPTGAVWILAFRG